MSRYASNLISPTLVSVITATTMLGCSALARQNAAVIPELSGQWGRDMLFFEPPLSGPGPIDIKRKSDGSADLTTPVGDYTSPILRREAADVVRKRGEIELSGIASPNPHNQCWPEAPPFILTVQFGVQIIQMRDEVVLLYLADHKVRHVRMNVPHPARLQPTWQGDSVGHYENGTLVIDTVGIKVGPLSMVDLYGTPHSEALHVVERYRLIDGNAADEAQRKHISTFVDPNADPALLAFELISPFYGRGPIDTDTKKKGLQVEITMEDPGVFTTPWSGLVTYRPVVGDWPETVCAENTREYYANRDTAIPKADKPDF